MNKLTLPMVVSKDTEKEKYIIEYYSLRLSVVFNKWFYCTELTSPLDISKLELYLRDQPKKDNNNNNNPHDYFEIHPTCIVEQSNHSIDDRIININNLSDCINKYMLSSKEEYINHNEDSILGTRKCADIVTGSQLNCYIDTYKLKTLYPYVDYKDDNDVNGAVVINIIDIINNEKVINGLKRIFPFQKSNYAYKQYSDTEKWHVIVNNKIDKRIINEEHVQSDIDSINSRAIVIPSGQILMTGNKSRRQVIVSSYYLLQIIASCVC